MAGEVKPLRVCIDPGHGGWDPGATARTGIRECDLNLPVSVDLAEILKRVPAQVLLTRTSDVGLAPAGLTGDKHKNADLQARANICNRWGASVFISVHTNCVIDARAHGIETFRYKAVDLAEAVQRHLIAFTGAKDRGAKLPQASKVHPGPEHWPVLHDTNCPAILVETGFLSHPGELALLLEPAYRVRLACAIAAGVMSWWGGGAKTG